MNNRLTCLDSEGMVSTAQYSKLRNERYSTQQCLEKLYEFENLEDDRRLIELPYEKKVWYLVDIHDKNFASVMPKSIEDLTINEIQHEIGKTYFSTKEEAEAKLKELNNNK